MSSASEVSPSVKEAQENPELVEINNCVRDTLASLDLDGVEFFTELDGETLKLTLQTKKFLEAQDLAVTLGKQIEQIAPANISELAVYKRKTAETKAFSIKQMALDKRRSAKPDRVATNPAPNSHSTPIPTKSPQQDRLSSPPNHDYIEQQVREICTNLDLGAVEFFIEIENETLSIIIQTKEFLEAQDLAENLGKQIEQIAPAGIRELAVYKRKNAETKAFLVNKMAVNKHDEPEEEVNIMTNLPNPTPNPYRRRRLSAFDQLIAIVVALTGIGMVFFGVIGQKYRQLNLEGGISNLSENKVGLLSSGQPIVSHPTNKTIVSVAERNRHNPHPVTTIPSPAPTTIVKTVEVTAEPLGELLAKTPEFIDVPKQWGETYITELKNRGILDDFGSGKFDPNQPITRGEDAKMLDRSFADKPASNTAANFKDIPSDYPHKEAIDKSVQLGFMTGYSPTHILHQCINTRFESRLILMPAPEMPVNLCYAPLLSVAN